MEKIWAKKVSNWLCCNLIAYKSFIRNDFKHFSSSSAPKMKSVCVQTRNSDNKTIINEKGTKTKPILTKKKINKQAQNKNDLFDAF